MASLYTRAADRRRLSLGAMHKLANDQRTSIPSPTYDTLPERDNTSYVIQSWDTSSKDGPASSFSTCTTWLVHKQCYYLLDVCRMKLTFPALRDMASKLSEKYKPRYILIEDASTGPALAAELKQHAMIRLIKPEQDKQVRLFVQQSEFASGRVWFPRQAPWLRIFLDELLSFPNSKYSDQVDSMSQALAFKHYDLHALNKGLASLTESYMFRYAMAQSRRF